MDNETIKVLKEILEWQKILGLQVLRIQLPKVLDGNKKKEVYEMTDGENSVASISKKTGVATGTISNWWNKWEQQGIVLRENGRFRKLVAIRGLDLESTNDE